MKKKTGYGSVPIMRRLPVKHMASVLCALSIATCTYAQNPDIERYRIEKTKKIDTVASYLKEKENLLYLSLLPSVGYNNLLADNGHFSINFNIGSLATYFQRKNRNKIEVEKTKHQLFERLDNEIDRLYKEYEEIQRDSLMITLEEENYNLSQELFELKRQQYEKNKITLETWLQVQEAHKAKEININKKKQTHKIKKANFNRKIKNPM